MKLDFFYFCVGFYVLAVFFVKPELLLNQFAFKFMATIAAAAFVMGIVVHVVTDTSDSVVGALFAPFAMLGYFWLLRRLYLKWVGREPSIAAINRATLWKTGPAEVRIFTLAFVFGSILMFFATVAASEQFSRHGW
jgi:hypothetical protein